MLKDSLLIVALCAGVATASAETLYVADSLPLGLHQAEDTSDAAFDNLVSGTALEVLDRNPNYARVRTPNGQVGWVKVAYLVELQPVQAQVAPVSSSSAAASQATLARLQRENEAYELRLERYRLSLPLPWVIAALFLTLVVGFLAGLWWLDALIRRRHGGFRIY